MLRLALMVLLGLAMQSVPASAKFLFDPSPDKTPLLVKSELEAKKLLTWAMGADLYQYLEQSNIHYTIEFDDKNYIGQFSNLPEEKLALLTGLFERDQGDQNTYSIHVNSDYCDSAAADNLSKNSDGMSDAEKNKARNLVRCYIALGIITHEAMHAFEMENHRVEITSQSDPNKPKVHVKRALDKFDEYYGFLAQNQFLDRVFKNSNLPSPETRSKQSVDEYYKSLRDKNYVVRHDQEVETPAPFPWDQGPQQASDQKRVAKDMKSFNDFLVTSTSGTDQSTASAGSALSTTGSSGSAAQTAATTGADGSGDASGSSDDSGDGPTAASLENGVDLPAPSTKALCDPGPDSALMAGGSDGQMGDNADAKRTVKPKGKP